MPYDIEQLSLQAKNADETERRYAAEDLGQCDEQRAVDVLLRLLGDESVAVREAALESLKIIGGTAVSEKAILLLESEDTPTRNYAVDILESVGGPSIPALVKLCDASSVDLRKFALDIIGNIGVKSESEAYARCLGLLEDANENVAAAAAEALGKIGESGALPFLDAKFESSHPWIQCHILLALAALDGDSALKILSKIDPAKLKPEVSMHLEMARNLLNARHRKSAAELTSKT